jgi:hypothetical protein
MIAGAGLMMIPGVGPLAAAGIVGGGYGLATGSVEKGLMAGLGAYGGAGLAGSLASAGTSAAVEAGGAAAVEQAALNSGTQLAAGTGGMGVEAALTPAQIQASNAISTQAFPNLNADAISGLREASLNAANPMDVVRSAGMGNVANSAQVVNPTFSQTAANIGRGAEGLGTSAGRSAVYNAMPTGTLPATAIAALTPDNADTTQTGYQEDEYDRRLKGYRLSPDYQAYVAPRPNPYYRPTYAAEGGVMSSFDDEAGSDTVGMASGGIARYRNKGKTNVMQDYLDRQEKEQDQMQKHLSTNVSSYMPSVGIFRDPDIDTAKKDALTASMIRLGKAGKGAGIKAVPLPKTSIRGLGDVRGATPEIEEAAEGGVMGYNLGGYSDGGRMLEGPGDGMSDSIPASIAGKQPARLADGEFVVPADVVSHLGNGSTDAGAEKLYKMMDKIRMARTGTKKQAPEIKADKYLPVKTAASGGIAGYAKGGIAGYATGGEVDALYQSILGRSAKDDPEGAAFWANSGLSTIQIAEAIRNSPEAKAASGNTGGVYQDKTFTDAQVASYLAGNNVKSPSDVSSVQNAFGISSDQIARAQNLIAQNDPSIAQAGADYTAAIAANPAQAAQNRIDYVTQVYTQQVGRAPDAEGLAYWTNALASGASPATVASEINRSLEGVNFDTQTIESAYNRNLRRTAEQEGFQFWLSNAQANALTQKQLMDAITKAAEAKEKVERGIQGKTFTELEVADFVADPLGGRRATKSIYDIPANEADRINISYINGIPVQFVSPVTERALISKYGEGAFTASMGEETYSPDRVAETADRAFRAGSMTQAEYDRVMTGLDGISKDIQAGKLDATTAGDNIRQLLNVPKGFKIIDPKYGQQIGEDNALDLALAEAAKRQEVLAAQDPGYYQANDILGQAYLNAGLDFPFMSSDYKANTMMTQADKLTAQNAPIKLGETTNQMGRAGPYKPTYDPLNQGRTPLPASTRDPYSDEGLAFLYGQMMDQYGTRDPSRVNPAIAAPNAPPVPYQPPPPGNLALNTPIRDAAQPGTPAPASTEGFFTAPTGQIFSNEAAYNATVAPAQGGKAGGLMSIDRKKRAKDKVRKGLKAA